MSPTVGNPLAAFATAPYPIVFFLVMAGYPMVRRRRRRLRASLSATRASDVAREQE
jgi:hypothetical protein